MNSITQDTNDDYYYYDKYRKYKQKYKKKCEQKCEQAGGNTIDDNALQADYDDLDVKLISGQRYNIIKFLFQENSGQAINAPHSTIILANKKIHGTRTRIGKTTSYLRSKAVRTRLPTKLLYVDKKTTPQESPGQLELQLHHNQPDGSHALHQTEIETIGLKKGDKIYIRVSSVIAYTHSVEYRTDARLGHLAKGLLSRHFALKNGTPPDKKGYLWISQPNNLREVDIPSGQEYHLNKNHLLMCILKKNNGIQGSLNYRDLDVTKYFKKAIDFFQDSKYVIVTGPATLYLQERAIGTHELKLQRFQFDMKEGKGSGVMESTQKKTLQPTSSIFHRGTSHTEDSDD